MPLPARAIGLALGVLTLALPLSVLHAAPVAAERPFAATTLTLAAYGESNVAPDQASLTLGVQSRAPTAAEAMARNAVQMGAVFAALHKAGIAERDVRTSNLNLSAEYTYVQNQPPTLAGYVAGNDVAITVRDLARLGGVVDAVTAAGANQINGVSFGLKDPTAAADAARLAAIKALSAKAALYANATGYHIARLVDLAEGGGEPEGPVRPMAYMARAQAAPSTPVAAGELTVRIDVTGVYELAK